MSQKSSTTSFIVSSNESLNNSNSICSLNESETMMMATNGAFNVRSHPITTLNDQANMALINQNGRSRLSLVQTQPTVPPPPPPLSPSQSNYHVSQSNPKIASTNSQHNGTGHPTNVGVVHPPNGVHGPPRQSETHSSNGGYEEQCYSANDSQNLLRISTNHHISHPNNSPIYRNQDQVASLGQSSPTSSLQSASSLSLMPVNVKAMLVNGVSSEEVLRNWLISLKCEDQSRNFIDQGYDMHLVTRMTPQDLAAVGCKSPALRKKLLSEIRKLSIDDNVPNFLPQSLDQWLGMLNLNEYRATFISEGFDTIEKVCQLTWEDLEEIGITKLGHQKKLLISVEKVRKLMKNEQGFASESQIYDVHPNQRTSLNGSLSEARTGTLSRVRSSFFQTRSGANLDHRGLPIATVIPAIKHVNGMIVKSDTTCHNKSNSKINSNNLSDGLNNMSLGMSDLAATLKRTLPPMPPVRTNSLKLPQSDMSQMNDHRHSVTIQPNHTIASAQRASCIGSIGQVGMTNSNSFLRTPKLGTLTATTNKMLTSGGHIQTLEGQTTTMRSIVPIREAPLPPSQTKSIILPAKIDEEPMSENPVSASHVTPPTASMNCDLENPTLISSSLIQHQLASADEFPPPPPCQ